MKPIWGQCTHVLQCSAIMLLIVFNCLTKYESEQTFYCLPLGNETNHATICEINSLQKLVLILKSHQEHKISRRASDEDCTYDASILAEPSLYWISVELLFKFAHFSSISYACTLSDQSIVSLCFAPRFNLQ